MYYLLTENFKQQEERLVDIIKKAVPVEKIYMLGSRLEQQRTESIFLTTAPSRRAVTHYWLLILVEKNCGHSLGYVQDKIENCCRLFIPVTAIVLYSEHFEKWLTEQHRFACKVMNVAVLLYGSKKEPYKKNTRENTILEKTSASDCVNQLDKISEFIAGAEFYRARRQNNMSAFMLHQAAEQSLLTIFKKATGLGLSSHNIDKLLRYCMMIDHKIADIFIKNNTLDEKLLSQLQQAYISARYKQDLSIATPNLVLLTERVRTLFQIARQQAG